MATIEAIEAAGSTGGGRWYSVLSTRLESLKNYGVGFGVLCYVVGFAVNSFYLARFGVVDADLIRTRYVLTGGMFLLFLLLVLAGALRGWSLLGSGGIAHPITLLWDLIQTVVRTSVILFVPFALIVFLPAYLAQPDNHLRLDRDLLDPSKAFLPAFWMAWAVSLVLAFAARLIVVIVGAVLQVGTRAKVKRAQTAFEYMKDQPILIGTTSIGIFSPWLWKSIWFRLGVLCVGVISLVVYTESIYDNIPPQLGGGKPVEIFGVSPELGTYMRSGAVPTDQFLVARTSDTYVFRVSASLQPDWATAATPVTEVVEVDKGEIHSIEYPDLTFWNMLQPGRGDVSLIATKLAEDGQKSTPLAAGDLDGWTFCVTLARNEQVTDVCDSDSGDHDVQVGTIHLSGMTAGKYVVTSMPKLQNGQASRFAQPIPVTVYIKPELSDSTDIVFTPSTSYSFLATKLAPDGSTQSLLTPDELSGWTFCVTLTGNGSTVTVCDGDAAADGKADAGAIEVRNLVAGRYVVSTSIPPVEGKAATFMAPDPITIEVAPSGSSAAPTNSAGLVFAPATGDVGFVATTLSPDEATQIELTELPEQALCVSLRAEDGTTQQICDDDAADGDPTPGKITAQDLAPGRYIVTTLPLAELVSGTPTAGSDFMLEPPDPITIVVDPAKTAGSPPVDAGLIFTEAEE